MVRVRKTRDQANQLDDEVRGYVLSRVYDGPPFQLRRGEEAVGRHREKAVVVGEHGSRYVFLSLEPTISPLGVARLTAKEIERARTAWTTFQYDFFHQMLAQTRHKLEVHLLKEGVSLDRRSKREAERLPYQETGGPWHRLRTEYEWQNAAGLYLPAEILDGRSLEEHVKDFETYTITVFAPKIRRLTNEEALHYSGLSAQLRQD